MLINPYKIPLVVKITNGKETHEILLPEKKKVEIMSGYRLHPQSKHDHPDLVDTSPAPVPVETVQASPVETPAEAPAVNTSAPEDNAAPAAPSKSANTKKA